MNREALEKRSGTAGGVAAAEAAAKEAEPALAALLHSFGHPRLFASDKSERGGGGEAVPLITSRVVSSSHWWMLSGSRPFD